MGNTIGLPTVNCFRFVCENLTTFPFGKLSLESSIRGVSGDIVTFKIKLEVCEKLPKSNDCSTQNDRTQQRNMHIHEWTPWRTANRARPELSFVYACWLQPAATRPFSQITLGRLGINYYCYSVIYSQCRYWRGMELPIHRSRVWILAGHHCVVALGNAD